jgi:co-chaperonin GroES (HSP10)
MKNKSGLEPLGRAVLVEPYEPEKSVKSTVIEIPKSARARMLMAEQQAIVIAIGPEAWKDERVPRASPGDHVMIAAYAGHMTKGPLDGKEYRVVNAADVFLRITTQ